MDHSSLEGAWINTNPDTTGITRIEIADGGDALGVRIHGACSPDPCDWGTQDATPYAYHVSGDVVAGVEVTYDFGFQEVLVVAIHNRGVLVIHTYHRFKDDSGRSNFIYKEFFRQ